MSSTQCLPGSTFTITMQQAQFKTFFAIYSKSNIHNSCLFDLQCNIVSAVGISFFASNLSHSYKIHVLLILLFSVYRYHENINFSKNIHHTKLESKTSNWCKFHIDPSMGSLPNSQMEKLGMDLKKMYSTALNRGFVISQTLLQRIWGQTTKMSKCALMVIL